MPDETYAEDLFRELLSLWGSPPGLNPEVPLGRIGMARALAYSHPSKLAQELGAQMVSEILAGLKAGQQGVVITTPDKLRMAIFIRGHTLQDFAKLANISPSTLSRALGGQAVAPFTWKQIITKLYSLN
ncbi:MAG: hypothetical protein ACREN8_13480 [Candidatus Dormibacteraceae bacterium]